MKVVQGNLRDEKRRTGEGEVERSQSGWAAHTNRTVKCDNYAISMTMNFIISQPKIITHMLVVAGGDMCCSGQFH